MKKNLALDLGDVWTGIAISDILGIIARPYKTVSTNNIVSVLEQILKEEQIGTIVIGYPKTMKGFESAQTKKVIAEKEILEKKLTAIGATPQWVLWDERLSSKRATAAKIEQGKKQKTKEDKLQSHAIAAAFILDSYLQSRAPLIQEEEE